MPRLLRYARNDIGDTSPAMMMNKKNRPLNGFFMSGGEAGIDSRHPWHSPLRGAAQSAASKTAFLPFCRTAGPRVRTHYLLQIKKPKPTAWVF